MTPMVVIEDLRVEIQGHRRTTIVDGINFQVDRGEIVGLAGESGSGKTMSMLALLGLAPPGISVSGHAFLDGQDLVAMSSRRLGKIRGHTVAMIFQDPLTSLHPMLTVERQITEHMRLHLGLDKTKARARAHELLEQVRMPNPARALRSYPHEFSGGMRQRIAIAIALACRPKLLIADEPTTALDTTVQAGILSLLDELRHEFGLAVVLITHNLGVVAALTERLNVMYSGRLVEAGATRDVLTNPRHPYTRALLDSLPDPKNKQETLQPIAGQPARPESRPAGCAFHPRCGHAVPDCVEKLPSLRDFDGHRVACPVDPFA